MKTAGQMAAFAAVSLLSFGLDWSLFSALWLAMPRGVPARLFVSVAAARCASLVFNYFCNRQLVFRRMKRAGRADGPAAASPRPLSSRSFPRYLALAAALLAGSWAVLKGLHAAFPRLPLAGAKPVVDAALFVVSFWVQRKFVFAAGRTADPEETGNV